MNRIVCLTDREAVLAANGELRAIVRKMRPGPPPCQTGPNAVYKYKDGWRYGGCEYNGDIVEPCPFGAPGDVLNLKETFWVKHDTEWDEVSGSTLDFGPSLCLEKDFRPGIQYVAGPECKNPPITEYQQTIDAYKGEIIPGYWWLSPPANWDGEDNDAYKKRGEWCFIPWYRYSKMPGICMPKWAIRRRFTVKSVLAMTADQWTRDNTLPDFSADGLWHIDYSIVDRMQETDWLWHAEVEKEGDA